MPLLNPPSAKNDVNSLAPWLQKKLVRPTELATWSEQHRNNHTIVTLNGSFDLLHRGHLEIIFEASQQGDLLLLALNSDASIQKYKSKDRPIIPLQQRLEMIAALEMIDFVTWFEETDPRNLLEQVRPHVHVNGAPYTDQCIEADVVHKHGGRLHLVSLVPGLSTTTIIERIQHLCDS